MQAVYGLIGTTVIGGLGAALYHAYGPQKLQIQATPFHPTDGPIYEHLKELDQKHLWHSGDHHLRFHHQDFTIPYVKGISGEFSIDIEPYHETHLGLYQSSVTIEGPQTEQKVFQGSQMVQIYASKYSRGFYIQGCQDTIGDVQIRYIGHDNRVIDKNSQWSKIDRLSMCEINRIRGVKLMEVMINELKDTPGVIKVTEEMWLLNDDFKLFFGLIIALASLTQVAVMYQTYMYQGVAQVQIIGADDEFGKLAQKFNEQDEDARMARASTMHSMASNNTSTSIVINTSIVSQQDSSMASPRGGKSFDVSAIHGIDEENAVNEESAIDEDFQRINRAQDAQIESKTLELFNWICFYSAQLANICAKALYLKFVPKTNKLFFMSMIGTSSAPYVLMFLPAMLCQKPTYYKSKLIVLVNCAQFTLELSNNLLIGQNWSLLQAVSPILTAYLIVFPLFKWQDQSRLNIMFIMLCNLYLLAISIYMAIYVFQNGHEAYPEWARSMMLNIGIGQTMI